MKSVDFICTSPNSPSSPHYFTTHHPKVMQKKILSTPHQSTSHLDPAKQCFAYAYLFVTGQLTHLASQVSVIQEHHNETHDSSRELSSDFLSKQGMLEHRSEIFEPGNYPTPNWSELDHLIVIFGTDQSRHCVAFRQHHRDLKWYLLDIAQYRTELDYKLLNVQPVQNIDTEFDQLVSTYIDSGNGSRNPIRSIRFLNYLRIAP